MSKSEELMIEIADIHIEPAAAVRAVMNSECVDRYMELVEDGVRLPAVDVFAHRDRDGGLTAYLGDGRHRLEAWTAVGQREALCSVVWCESVAEAERRAWEHAAGANATHGLPRTNEDKVAAVRAVIGRPEYETVSDRELGRLCRVTKYLVRKVREDMSAAGKLSGGASAASRDYKPAPGRTAARGVEPPTPPAVPALDAELAVVVEKVSAEPAAVPGGQLTSAAGGGGQLTSAGGEELGEVELVVRPVPSDPVTKSKPADQVRDGAGRVVPDHMADLFRCGRALTEKVRENRRAEFELLQAAAVEPWGAAVPSIKHTYEAESKSIVENVASSFPAYLCPYVNEAGTHTQPGACRVCIGRGWLTRHVFRQIPDVVKQMCRSKAGKDTKDRTGGEAA